MGVGLAGVHKLQAFARDANMTGKLELGRSPLSLTVVSPTRTRQKQPANRTMATKQPGSAWGFGVAGSTFWDLVLVAAAPLSSWVNARKGGRVSGVPGQG